MRICAVIKYPPIQGGVSAHGYWLVRSLALRGHQVVVVTNADEVEPDYRLWIPEEDRPLLEGRFPGGGSVTVVGTASVARERQAHVPGANPYVTKLAGLGAEAIRRHDCDVVLAYYFEPYGMAGLLAASWTDRPFVLQHAGSDRTDLMSDPDLTTAYRELVRRADLVVAPPATLEGFGVPTESTADLPPPFLPSTWATGVRSGDGIGELVARLAADGHPGLSNHRPIPDDVPVVAVYGKVGATKGHLDLVEALRLAARRREFILVAPVGGPRRAELAAAIDDAGLAERSWLLPFLPHWRVPTLLAGATAVCFLERGFAVDQHRPGVPTEILGAGRCLVLSAEVARKQVFRDRLRHGENVLLSEDPRDTAALAETLGLPMDDPGRAAEIGAAGRSLPEVTDETGLATAYEDYVRRAQQLHTRPRRVRSAERTIEVLVRRHLPGTTRLAPALTAACVRDAGGAARDADAARRLALDLADDLVRRIGLDADLPPRAVEVARFERDLLWLRVDLESGVPMFPPAGAAGLRLSRSTGLDGRTPVRSNWLRTSTHAADVVELADRARTGGTLGDRPEDATFLLVKTGDLGGTARRVNSTTLALLDLCDGRTSTGRIVALMAEQHGCSREDTVRALRTLVQARAVRP